MASIKCQKWAETLRKAKTSNGSAWKLTRILTKNRPKIHHLDTVRGSSCRQQDILETLAESFEAYHQLPDAPPNIIEDVERTLRDRRKQPG